MESTKNLKASKNFEYIFKIVLAGDVYVGKSCLIQQLVSNHFENTLPTTGPEFQSKVVNIGEKNVKLQIWDTSGHEAFNSLTKSYYRSMAGVVVVYDLSRRETFKNLQNWLDDIIEESGEGFSGVLIANKLDLEAK